MIYSKLSSPVFLIINNNLTEPDLLKLLLANIMVAFMMKQYR